MSRVIEAVAASPFVQGHAQEARTLSRAGFWIFLATLVPIGLWLTLAPLTSAVVAQGFVKVDLNRRPVQHAEGGMVREVMVRDGQRVKAGDPLLALGDVSVDAENNRLGIRVLGERAAIARLEAEQTLQGGFALPADLAKAAAKDRRVAELVTKERSVFTTRRGALLEQTALLRSQRERVGQEITSLRAQIVAAGDSLKFQKSELETNRDLASEGFIARTRIAQLESSTADYGVKLEERRSELARAEQRLVDTDLRIRSLESEYRQQAGDQLKAAYARLSELEQELRKSSDASSRQLILAPAAGQVLDLRYTAPGAVITPREVIAEIVPDDTRLVVEARIPTEDINRVALDQHADIRFTAFKYRTTGLVSGKVIYVSPDRLVERTTNMPYYSVMIEVDAKSLAEQGNMALSAGMPAEVFVTGDRRTPLEYMLEPLVDSMRHAARER